MKFISPTWAATQKIYNINKKMTILILIILILMIVMIGRPIVRYQVPVIKQIKQMLKTHLFRNALGHLVH